ncbi:MAG: ExeM/NucH family extracellular endonuclease, partial [Anaerolineaceae bacterium]|nr:ExeM/NucH family extracellular endonuclease [Anaerolineaceae bacterium]
MLTRTIQCALHGLFAAILAAGLLFGTAGSPALARLDELPSASPSLVISQFQVAGKTGAASDEFVEMHNNGSTSVNLNGYQLVSKNAIGTSDFELFTPSTNLVIPAGGYFLLAASPGYTGTVTPDATYPASLAAPGGGIAIRNATSAILDSLGYGNATNAYVEGAVTTSPSNGNSMLRKNGGCQDTDDNFTDFSSHSPSAPRNSLSPIQTCGPVDNPPSISSTSPAGGATNVSLTSDLSLTFSEAVTPAQGWFTISCTLSGAHSAAVFTPDQLTFSLNPGDDFILGDSCTVIIDHARIAEQEHPTETMVDDYSWSFAVIQEACGGSYTHIHAIQGSGSSSPLLDATVIVQGVVTGDFQAAGGLSGFFLQSLPQDEDGDALSSEGIFVTATTPVVSVGDRVQIKGSVQELQDLTELSDVTEIIVCGSGNLIQPIPLSLPVPDEDTLEQYEGMLVRFTNPFTVSQNYFLGQSGQLTLSAGDRLYAPTNGQAETGDLNRRRRLVLDDGSSLSKPATTPYLALDNTIRQGDTLAPDLTGLLDQGLIAADNQTTGYRLQPRVPSEVVFARVNQRTIAPDPVGGSVTVAGFNIHNYFTTLGSRGAQNQAELERQTIKLVEAMSAIHADVFALQEVERGGSAAVDHLVETLNAKLGAGAYAAIPNPIPFGVGDDAIQNALIYRPGRITPFGPSMSPNSAAEPFTVFTRLPVAQAFETNGQRFTVVANHFKSRGCDAGATGLDGDQADGQACYNHTRTLEAAALLAFIDQIKVNSADDDILVLGDLNSYGREHPIELLEGGGLTNEISSRVPLPDRYSYTFDGQSGTLDHALATASLDLQITGVDIWHINADEPKALDYEIQPNPANLYQPDAYRSSDHDPLIVGLDLQTLFDVSLAPAADAKSGEAGATVSYTLTLENRGTQMDTYTLSFTGNQWPGEMDPTTVTLGGGATRDVTVTVHVPPGQPGNANDSLTVKATSRARPAKSTAATLTTHVPALYALKLESIALTQPGAPGAEVVYPLLVTNIGNAPQTFDVHLAGNTWDTTVAPPTFPVLPGSTQDLTVKVSVPAGAAGLDTDAVQVIISSRQDASVTGHLLLTTTVAPLHRLAVSPTTDAKNGYPGQALVYRLRLANTGADTETFQF